MTLFAAVLGENEKLSEAVAAARRRMTRFPGDRWRAVARPGFALGVWQRWVGESAPPDGDWDVAERDGWVAVASGYAVVAQNAAAGGSVAGAPDDTLVAERGGAAMGLAARLLADFVSDPMTRPRAWQGQFAFVAWHEATQRLFLVRDPFGIEPLYWGRLPGGGVAVANLAKTLVAMGVADGPDALGWASFFLWGNVDGRLTVFSGVKAAPQGSVGIVAPPCASAPQWQVYRDLRTLWAVPSAPEYDDAAAQVAISRAVRDAVAAVTADRQRTALFLSGGIDSGVVAGVLAQLGRAGTAYTLTFAEMAGQGNDERPWAERIARHYGLTHRVDQVAEPEFWATLPDFLDAMDQPTLDGINFWLSCQKAAQAGEGVVCTGDGGDELFGGFTELAFWRRADAVMRWVRSVPGGKSALKLLFRCVGTLRRRPKWQWGWRYLDSPDRLYFLPFAVYFPEELPQLGWDGKVGDAVAQLHALAIPEGDCLERTMQMRESFHTLPNHYFRDAHWIGAAHGVQLRHPLASVSLLSTVAPWVCAFRGRRGKTLLAQAPQPPLPPEVVARPKVGFATPVAGWLAQRVFPTIRFPAVATIGSVERRLAWWLYQEWSR
jgi:asparagine synthase (glutamine-hydrolysing)